MNKKGHDYSTLIIWASALVGMIRYAAAFLAADLGMIEGALSELVTFLLGVSGFFMGILGTLGTAYIFDGWRQKMPAAGNKWSNKFKALTVIVMLALFTEILILVPFTMSRVLHLSVADVLDGGVWWWSTAVVVMPFLLIGGVSLGNQVVTVESGQMSGQMSGLKKKTDGKTTDESGQMSGQMSEDGMVNVPADWRKASKILTVEQKRELVGMSTSDICYRYGLENRQARRWREKAAEEVSVAGGEG